MKRINLPYMEDTRRLSAALLDFLLPPRCPACNRRISDHHHLCGTCFADLHFISDPKCQCCGMSFDIQVGDDPLCAACLADPPPYDWAASAMVYDQQSKAGILRMKHAGSLEYGPHFARLLLRLLQERACAPDMFVPVPLHARRLFVRGFNQSAEIARHLVPLTGAVSLPTALVRRRNTPTQAGLTRRQRQRNVAGAFDLNPRTADRLKGKTVILIDDVMTTGATIDACVRALRKAKPATIGVLTLARTAQKPAGQAGQAAFSDADDLFTTF